MVKSEKKNTVKNSSSIGIFFVFLIILALVMSVVIVHQFRHAREIATQSTISSLNKSLLASTLGDALTSSSEWTVLGDVEYDRIISALPKNGSIDKGPSGSVNDRGGVTDLWDNRFKVATRQNDQGIVDWKVWSMGPDSRSGSDDDIHNQ